VVAVSLRAQARVELDGFALDVELDVGPGQTVAVIGPNGGGKTTLLRAVAGLRALTAGRIELDGEVLDDPAAGRYRPPERRSVGVVFQDHLLFPHLTALENVAFGLRARGARPATARRRARAWLERVGLADRAAARPAQLSGGQAQRVALARALATEPRVLLLDEPLAALDASTRHEVRRDLRRHLTSFPGVRLLVTHDPVDVAVLADHVVVLDGGAVAQTGPPEEITARPRTAWVAELAGTNLFRGTAAAGVVTLDSGRTLVVADHRADGAVCALVHPRAVALHPRRPRGSPRNAWSGRVASVEPTGDRARVRIGGPLPITAEVTAASVGALDLAEGREVWVAVKATEVDVYPS
jgi:molybdate transport system ATP-binding protein